jgi:hypothetical protein
MKAATVQNKQIDRSDGEWWIMQDKLGNWNERTLEKEQFRHSQLKFNKIQIFPNW